jgi:hypothetical protein
MHDIRPSPIAGRWYPGDAAALTGMVEGFLDAARPDSTASDGAPAGSVVGLLAPHAGLMYSGLVAACAFRLARGLEVEAVAVVCPSHFHDDGPVLTSAHDGYRTPLGAVPVDQALVGRIRAALAPAFGRPPGEALVALRRDREHAVEIELPFLQRVLAPGFVLLPLMIRDQSAPAARALGHALAEALAGRRALLVASSDLSHYHPQATALALDREMLRQVEAFDPQAVLDAQEDGRGFACGAGAIAATFWAARDLGASRVHILRHATSGDVSGDYESVVGYGAAVLMR